MAKTLMKGNEAIAKAALKAGCDAYYGYPITPQSEITEYMSKIMVGANKAFVQAESEVSAINMAYGAAGAGFNVMTASSSPGIALKQEGISYAAGAELPIVIAAVARSGPGLGGIQPGQSDYTQAVKGGGNGDYNIVVYAPKSIQESADYTQKAFDVAAKFRTPVMVQIDGAIGQMMEAVEIKDFKIGDYNREDWACSGNYEQRGKVNRITSLHMKPEDLEQHNFHLQAKFKKMQEELQEWEEYMLDDAEYVFIAYGTAARIVQNAVDALREKGIKVGLIRPISLWPFPVKALEKLNDVKGVMCAELSHGQMIEDVKMHLFDLKKLIPVGFVGRAGGVIFTPEEVADKFEEFKGGL